MGEDIWIKPSSEVMEINKQASHQNECLMERVSHGERQALTLLYQNYVLQISAYFRTQCQSHCHVEDMTQEVFKRIWEKREKYHSGTPDLSYLYGFARMVLKEYRAKLRSQSKILTDTPLDFVCQTSQHLPYEQAVFSEQTQALRRFISNLPPKQRQAMELVYLKGMTSLEAAKILSCSDKTVRNHCRIGLKRLKKWIKSNQ